MIIRFRNFILPIACGMLLTGCGLGITVKSQSAKSRTGYYHEKYRPQFHFSPEKGWMNDPNGLVCFDSEYHLFYQYYPDSTVWGPMHWGHAVSKDLVHWQHLPVALYPDSLGYIFSGSAVADTGNTSGLGTKSAPPLVAVFTYHDPVAEKSGSITFQNQGIAYSVDKGRTWTKYQHNPVLKNPGIRDFRDPKVFWHDGTGRWIMIMAAHDRIRLYSSPDLKDWTFESDFGEDAGAHGGVWECPDLFPLKIEGSAETKWVMLVSINPGGPSGGSSTQYFTGEFDGHKFVPDETSEKWIDWGSDNYAGVTWSGIPAADGRRLFIGWMSNWNYAALVPSSGWRSAMTLPRELLLSGKNGRYMLVSKPAHEIETLRFVSKSTGFQLAGTSKEQEILNDSFDLDKCELEFDFNFSEKLPDTLRIVTGNSRGEKLVVGFSSVANRFYIDRMRSGITTFSKEFGRIATAPYKAGKNLKIHLFFDAASAELFVDGGKLVMTSVFFPSVEYTKLNVFAKGGDYITCKAKFYELDRIWSAGK
jgi:fructan beta-fructosidase